MPIAYTDTVTDTKVDNIALDRNRRACIRSLVAIRESQRDGHFTELFRLTTPSCFDPIESRRCRARGVDFERSEVGRVCP